MVASTATTRFADYVLDAYNYVDRKLLLYQRVVHYLALGSPRLAVVDDRTQDHCKLNLLLLHMLLVFMHFLCGRGRSLMITNGKDGHIG
jgi:hypothetical protein